MQLRLLIWGFGGPPHLTDACVCKKKEEGGKRGKLRFIACGKLGCREKRERKIASAVWGGNDAPLLPQGFSA